MALKLIAFDPRTNTATDLSSWGLLFEQLAEAYEATGRASTLTILLRSYNGTATLPIVPVPGLQLVFGDDAAYPGNPDPWEYYFTGRVITPTVTIRVDGLAYALACGDFAGELNMPTPGLTFNATDHPTDSARITAALALVGPPGVWDDVTAVGGPFVTYAAGSETPVTGKLSDILTAIAADPGDGTVAPRKWFTSAAWTVPGDYTFGLTRYVHYASTLGLPPDPTPLTDAPDGLADWAFDSFNRGNNPVTLGTADSGHGWNALAGVWGTNSSRAYNVTGGSNNAAIVVSQISDPIVEVTLQTVQDGAGLAFRVAADTGGAAWQGWMLIGVPSNSRYELYKRAGGTNTLVGTINTTPASGDLLRVTLVGAGITAALVRSGSIVGSVATTDAFAQGNTWHGLAASAWHFPARWEDFRVRGPGAPYSALQDTEDGTGLANLVQIAGPAQDPLPVAWDTVTQPPAYVTTAPGFVAKTRGTDAWDAGATVLQLMGQAGGAFVWSTDTRLIGSDTFTRADNSQIIGGLETGQDWQRYNAAYRWGVSGGQAYCAQVGPSGMGIVGADFGAASCIIECALPVIVSSASRICVRVTDQDNCLLVMPNAGRYECYRRQAGVLTLLNHGSAVPAAGDTVKIDLAGSTINVYVNGVPDFSTTETFNQTATFHGFGTTAAGAAARWDNFTVRQTYATRTVGLRYGASMSTRQTPDFGIAFTAARSAQVTEGGVLKGSARTYGAGDFWRIAATLHATAGGIRYDIEYAYRAAGTTRWVLWYTSTSHPDLRAFPDHVDVALFTGGSSIGNLTYSPPAADLFLDLASVGVFGLWPAGDLIQNNSLDTYAKRQGQAQSFFAERAGLRKTYTLQTLRRYRGGTSVLFTCLRLGILNARKAVVTAKTNRDTHSRTVWLYELTLDAPKRMFGVHDRNPFLSAGPDGVLTPTAPTGLAQTGPGVPDSENAVSVVPLGWDAPQTDAQWIDLWAQRVGGPPDVVTRLPAAARAGTINLAFLQAYHLQARFVPYAGPAGPWCAPIDVTGGAPGLPPAPQNLVLTRVPAARHGFGQLRLTWDPLPRVNLYEVHYTPAGKPEQTVTTTGTSVVTLLLNLQYACAFALRASETGGTTWGPWAYATWDPAPPSWAGETAWNVVADPTTPLPLALTDPQGVDADLVQAYKVAWSDAGVDLLDDDGLVLLDDDGVDLLVPGLDSAALRFQSYDADDAALTPQTVALTPIPLYPEWATLEDLLTMPLNAKTLQTFATAVGVAGAILLTALYGPPASQTSAVDYGAGTVNDAAIGQITQPGKLALRTGPGGGFEIYDGAGNLRGRLFYDVTGFLRLYPIITGGQDVGTWLASTYGDTIFVGDVGGGGIAIGPAPGAYVTIHNGHYYSGDGSAGVTRTVTISGETLTIKDGIIVGVSP